MGTFRITVEKADPSGQRFEPVEMLVGIGAAFTKAEKIAKLPVDNSGFQVVLLVQNVAYGLMDSA